jgi:hypothetical protein
MHIEAYTFSNTEAGLVHALEITLSLRRAGFRTRLEERLMPSKSNPDLDCAMVTVLATAPKHDKRAANLAAMLLRVGYPNSLPLSHYTD